MTTASSSFFFFIILEELTEHYQNFHYYLKVKNVTELHSIFLLESFLAHTFFPAFKIRSIVYQTMN